MDDLRTNRRNFLLAAGALSASGCIGSFGLTNLVFDWNRGLGNKWVSALVFFAFVVLPVYGLLLFIDAIALNVIEFWTGSHPVGGSATQTLDDGRRLVTTAMETEGLLQHQVFDGDDLQLTFFSQHAADGTTTLLDGEMRPLVKGLVVGDGLSVRDGADRELLHADARALSRTRGAVDRGESLAMVSEAGARFTPEGDAMFAATADFGRRNG